MATTFRIIDPPDPMPDWYPPIDPEHPADHPLRYVELDMLIEAMIFLGIVAEEPAPGDELVPAARLQEAGSQMPPEECALISRGMRRFAREALPEGLLEALRERWTDVQDEFRRQMEERGELVVSGLEPFPCDGKSLRNSLLHWGAFNAIDAGQGGCEAVE